MIYKHYMIYNIFAHINNLNILGLVLLLIITMCICSSKEQNFLWAGYLNVFGFLMLHDFFYIYSIFIHNICHYYIEVFLHAFLECIYISCVASRASPEWASMLEWQLQTKFVLINVVWNIKRIFASIMKLLVYPCHESQ